MESKPSGLVTFLFTDIEGSIKLAQKFPRSLPSALIKHNSILNQFVKLNNGFIFKTFGDAYCCAFENVNDAVKAAVESQIHLTNENWNDAVIRVRMGIHSGRAEWNGEEYGGYITLARADRVMSVAFGGQIIVSNDANELLLKNENLNDSSVKYFPAGSNEIRKILFRDLGERRLKDVIQPIRLYQIIAPGLREDFPPLKTLDARPNNLPVQLTSFIGREKEITVIKNLLEGSKLLTLIGAGGTGKTRLALQAAADVIDDYTNGVWLAGLASLNDPMLLPHAITKVLGIEEQQGHAIEQTIVEDLKDKEMLIILDNCEHLIEEAANLAELLLTNCPKLKIIATSREVLKCSGEQTLRIQSLSFPDPDENNTYQSISRYEAARLFIERATVINPKFTVNNDNASALAEICHKLDGIPLALELAAARINILSLEKINERLNDRFGLLTGGKRTALPRQQTLRALIDWSYNLLSEKEKILWRRLTIFSGGWSLESAEEICSDETISKEDIMELLFQLTEKSIIMYDKNRYRILETLKQYGEEKLIEASEVGKMLSKHLQYFREFSESVTENSIKKNPREWLNILDIEHSNLQSAILYSIKSGQLESGIQLALNLGNFWNIRGHYTTGSKLLGSLLENPDNISRSLYIKSLLGAGSLATVQGDFEKAAKLYENSLKLSQESDDKMLKGLSFQGMGSVSWNLGNYDLALTYYNEYLKYSREIGNKNNISHALYNVGIVDYYEGRFQKSKKCFEESLALSRESGDIFSIAKALNALGNLENVLSNYGKAIEYANESLELTRESGAAKSIAHCHNNLGNTLNYLGNYEEAEKHFKESLEIYRKLNMKSHIASCLGNLGNVSYNMDNLAESIAYSLESKRIGQEIGSKRLIVINLIILGKVSLKKSQLEEAENYFNSCLTLSREQGEKLCIAKSMNGLGFICINKGVYNKAQSFYHEALIIGLEIKVDDIILESGIGSAVVLYHQNHITEAVSVLAAADKFIEVTNFIPDQYIFLLKEKIKKNIKHDLGKEIFAVQYEKGITYSIKEAAEIILSISNLK